MAVVHVAVRDPRRLVREGLCLLLNDEPDIVAVDFYDEESGAPDVILVGRGSADDVTSSSGTRVVAFHDASTIDEILAAIDVVARSSSSDESPADEAPVVTPSQTLTRRETEILARIAAGLSASEVSDQLGISRKTVEGHKRRIFTKLDVQNQAHAVAVATRAGLLDGRG